MKITLTKESLSHGLQTVQNVVGARSTLPILGNVLLIAEKGKLEMRATDLEVSVVSAVEAQTEREGMTTLPAKRLFGLVREIPEGDVEIEVNNKEVCTLSAGPAKYKLNGLAAEEFPPLPKFKESQSLSLPQERLRDMLRKTAYAVSTDESRYQLNGICFSVAKDRLTLVATDGRRLALTWEELEANSERDFIVPTKAVNELSRAVGDAGVVEMRVSDSQVEFTISQEGEPVRLYSKLVEASYPNYKQVIPTEHEDTQRIELVREELLQALRRADQITSDKANSVKLTFTANNLAITANSPEVGSGHDSIAIKYKGGDIEVAFNPGYMMDPLKILEEDEVCLKIKDSLTAGILDTKGSNFMYVLMPMRTN